MVESRSCLRLAYSKPDGQARAVTFQNLVMRLGPCFHVDDAALLSPRKQY